MLTLENQTYPIVETFHSLQGEGYWSGVNAFFIRLGGCDVYCSWCDQKETWNAKRHPQRQISSLAEEVSAAKPAIVVITGGEPLMHDLNPLTSVIKTLGMRVHLETSGAHPFSGNFDWVTFSPKPFKQPHDTIFDRADELKVVVANPKDLQWAETQAEKVRLTTLKYLQPEWNSPASKELIFSYILAHPEWRMSLQTHKFLNIC
jgi:7-carboxy-7-deazaguanine synthase